MPVMDGLQTTQAIRAKPEYQTLPIIAMTARAMAEDHKILLATGMNDQLLKPFEPEALHEMLLKWIKPKHHG